MLITEEIELSDPERIRTLREKENCKYLGILEAYTTKQTKKNRRKEFLRRIRKLFEIKFCSKNFIKEINTGAVSPLIYSEPFLKWTREELD